MSDDSRANLMSEVNDDEEEHIPMPKASILKKRKEKKGRKISSKNPRVILNKKKENMGMISGCVLVFVL